MKTFYRTVYKTTDGELIKSHNFYDLETAQRITTSLNRKYKQPGDYSIEGVDISELKPDQLARLYQLKLITYRELQTYAGLHIAERELRHRYDKSQHV